MGIYSVQIGINSHAATAFFISLPGDKGQATPRTLFPTATMTSPVRPLHVQVERSADLDIPEPRFGTAKPGS